MVHTNFLRCVPLYFLSRGGGVCARGAVPGAGRGYCRAAPSPFQPALANPLPGIAGPSSWEESILRKGQKTRQMWEGLRKLWEKQPCRRGQWRREGEGAPHARGQTPLQLMAEQAVLLQPMDDHSGADTHLHPMRTPRWKRWTCPEGLCSLWRAYSGACPLQEKWSVGHLRWSSLFLKDCTI